jgi:hypothetical protein
MRPRNASPHCLLQHFDQNNQAQQAKWSHQWQRDNRKVEQVPEKPPRPVGGEAKPGNVIQDEQGPDDPADRPQKRRFAPMEPGEYLHGVHDQE